MPSFKIAGKSKEDLIVVAQLAGLITAEESAKITRAGLVKLLEAASRASEEITEKAPAVPTRVKTARVRKAAAKADDVLAEMAPEPDSSKPPAMVKVKRIARTAKAKAIDKTPSAAADLTDPAPAEVVVGPEAVPDKPVRKTEAKKQKTLEPAVVQPAATAQTLPEPAPAPAAPRRRKAALKMPEPTPAAVPVEVQPTLAVKPARRKKTIPESPSAIEAPALETALTAPETAVIPVRATVAEPAAELTAEPAAEPSPDREVSVADPSPEATEAASDKEPIQERPDLHRVPAHHTLKASRPAQRRTTRVIGEAIPANGRQDRIPSDQSEFIEDSASQQAADSTAAAEPGSVIIPIQPGLESEPPRIQRPAVEAGDVQAGVLEIMPDGYGFLRKENYLQGTKDIYVPPQYIRRFGLRPGDFVTGPVKLQRESDRYQALLYIKDVNGMLPEKMLRRPHFDRLTPIYPDERFILETVRNELSTRIIDLVAPIGRGQRGMIVSPPKAGKTILLQKIANAISTNNPDVKLIVLLIDERPEEVTDMQRSINGEVVYSTFDKTPENHTKVTELVLERAMRLVELKQDVVILLDSMTRLARAYNLTINPTGRTLSGGLDPGALYGPKRFFGAARNIENGGSLTIIATSLIETGSRMDEVIFEEFKGTGNMEVYLDRKMSEKRIFPAIDINKSGTRREELLMTTKELDAVWTIRKAFSQLDTTAVTEAIINLLLKTKNNEHFIASVNVSFNDKNVFEAMRGVRPNEPTQGPQNTRTSSHSNAGYSSNYRRQTGPEEE